MRCWGQTDEEREHMALSHYPTDDISWLDFRGKEVLIQTSAGEMPFRVKEIPVFINVKTETGKGGLK